MCNFARSAFEFFFDRLDLGSNLMHWNILVLILAIESSHDDYFYPKLVKYALNDQVSLCGMNTKDSFLVYHDRMSQRATVHGKLSDIGNNEGSGGKSDPEYPLYTRSAWSKI